MNRTSGQSPRPESESLIRSLNPAIPRRFLLIIAGGIWSGAGLLLCARAYIWFQNFGLFRAVPLESVACILAAAGYFFGFTRLARKNIRRISDLPSKACIFAFTAWRGYLIIGTMVTLGILIRSSSFPRQYLAVLYGAMGGSLLLASILFYAEFGKTPAPELSDHSFQQPPEHHHNE